MNIHHLGLFYHVTRCAGVGAAARQMPCGIQQPAISSRIPEVSFGALIIDRAPPPAERFADQAEKVARKMEGRT